MNQSVLALVEAQNLPDNNLRRSAELEFASVAKGDASATTLALLLWALNQDIAIATRQSCLLHLRRLVPQYWSLGFQSFVGPPIDQQTKHNIRDALVSLCTVTTSSKLRKACAYVVVQIASADYPDEWPDLIARLYSSTSDPHNEIAVLGGVTVLNDLFDDLIDEDQFWNHSVGITLIGHLDFLLAQNISSDTKTACINLYHGVLGTLKGPEAFASEERKLLVQTSATNAAKTFSVLLEKSAVLSFSSGTNQTATELYYRSHIYKVLTKLVENFKLPDHDKLSLLPLLLRDLDFSSSLYHSVCVNDDGTVNISLSESLDDASTVVTSLLLELFRLLQALQHHVSVSNTGVDFAAFFQSLVRAAVLPRDTIDLYDADFNSFITQSSGLSPLATVRDNLADLLAELNHTDAAAIFHHALQSLGNTSWKLIETVLFVLECLFTNDDLLLKHLQLTLLLSSLTSHISYNSDHPLVTARAFLTLPRFFEKFSEQLSPQSFGVKAFSDMILFAKDSRSDDFNLVRASVLLCVTLYSQFLDLSAIEKPLANELQTIIFQITASLLNDTEEDGLPTLLEAVSAAISIDHGFASRAVFDGLSTIDLIFRVAFKDPSNVQLTIEAPECLGTLLSDSVAADYLANCERSLPFLLDIIRNSTDAQGEYSPQLYLSLELLGIMINSAPPSPFSPQIFDYTFPPLKDVLLVSNDDQILQSSGEVFNNLVDRASQLFLEYKDPAGSSGISLLLTIVSKFLSPVLSDSAAMNSGTIVRSLLTRFQDHLDESFLSQILEATVKRLIISKEVVTTENLIMVICDLVLKSPEAMVDFLSSKNFPDPTTGDIKPGLTLVMPLWFDSFEVTRGYERIKQNTLALCKILVLGDQRLASLIVNGEIIPYEGEGIITRSMARQRPDQYTQIAAPLKIIKLLLSELSFQCQQPDAEGYLPEQQTNDDDGWEDMDDIGVPNYEKLKSYVDSDEESEGPSDDGLKNLLVQFFKECVSKNLGHFQDYYTQLDDDEKKILTESVVFD